MPQNFYEVIWIFMIYAILGWCMEVSYAALDTGRFVNRGFLNGPYCPVYGCGVVIVISILTPLKENLLILFTGSLILTTVLEFITGFVLEKVFHNKWWDYSDKPFNIKGYVCLKFSIYWGLACTFVMDILHPVILSFLKLIPHALGSVVLILVMSGFTIDVCVTVSTILKFNRHLKLLDEIAVKIHNISDEMGENIYENVTNLMDKKEIVQSGKRKAKAEYEARMEVRKAEYEELKRKYKELIEQKNVGFSRLVNAFPNMISRDRNEILQKYRNYLNTKRAVKKEKNLK